MIVKPHSKLKGWFLVDMEAARPTYGLPGMKLEDGKALVHRNLLPLIEHPDAIATLAPGAPRNTMWEARDRVTADRGFKLRTTQHEAMDFMIPRRGTLLGDEMRLGKTLSAIMTHDPARGPFVVVAPLSTRGMWLGWLRRVFPQFVDQMSVLTGRTFDPKRVEDKRIIFAHYDIMQAWQVPMKIGTLVLDEAHLLVNSKTRRTLGCAFHASRSEKVIAMTGTPIWDLPPDLWAVANMITPGAWGAYFDFSQRYGAPVATGYGTRYTGLSNGAELRMRMSEVMLRRLWKDRADDVPPITRSVVVAEVNDVARNKLDILAAKLKSERTNTAGNLAAYRRQITTYKLPEVRREAQKIVERNEPVVVWTWHKDFAERIAAEFPGRAFVIHGDVSADEREKRIDAWRAHPASLLVATMAVAQVGIDLSHARIAIFAEIDYTPAVLGQAEMRTFAPTRGMDILFVVANHIVDQRIVRALINKLSAANPLGVGAAVDAIDALRDAVLGPKEEGDLDRLLEDLLASAT